MHQLLPDLTLLVPFLIAGLVLNMTPGVDMAYVLAKTTAQGRSAGLVAALGICLGSMVHATASALGISALLLASETAFLVLKICGALYLLYIAVRMIRSGNREMAIETTPPLRKRKILAEAMLTNLLNPKVGLFMLAFLPQFVDAPAQDAVWQVLALGLLFNLNSYLFFVALILLVTAAAKRLRTSARVKALLRWATASILGGMALRLAFADR